MRQLPIDFNIKQYGIECRLVTVDDAEFILSLRQNESINKHISTTFGGVVEQKQWIVDYKEREKKGAEYYFIYFHNGYPIGVNRIYNIRKNEATVGSWICKPEVSYELPILTIIIVRNILFEQIGADADIFDVRKGNSKVIKMHKMFGAEQIGETDKDLLFKLKKDEYIQHRDEILNFYEY